MNYIFDLYVVCFLTIIFVVRVGVWIRNLKDIISCQKLLIAAYEKNMARISIELGLPPSHGPAPGVIANLVKLANQTINQRPYGPS